MRENDFDSAGEPLRKRQRTLSTESEGSGSYEDERGQQPLPLQAPAVAAHVQPAAQPLVHPPANTSVSQASQELTPDGNEYLVTDTDPEGERKCDMNGYLSGPRSYRLKTFTVPLRGNKLFMLATEASRTLGYRDSYLMFNKNKQLFKIITTAHEKEHLIAHGHLPNSFRSRQIAIVTAKSMFRQFGHLVIAQGQQVVDDYWEDKTRARVNEQQHETATRQQPPRTRQDFQPLSLLSRTDRTLLRDSPAEDRFNTALVTPSPASQEAIMASVQLAGEYSTALSKERAFRRSMWREFWQREPVKKEPVDFYPHHPAHYQRQLQQAPARPHQSHAQPGAVRFIHSAYR